jgi:DNA repair protein RadC
MNRRAPEDSRAEPAAEGHRRRLRERFERGGFSGFAEHEVVELLLTLAIPRRDVKPAARALIARFGSLRGLLDAPIEEVREVPGVGTVAPVALRVIREAATLYLQQAAEGRDCLADPDALERFWRLRIGSLPHEVFQVGYLDTGLRLLRDGIQTLAEGTVDRAAVYPRRVVEAALRRGAAALVFAHNHPHGDVRPSEHDKTVTRALGLAAHTVQLRVVDHLVVSPDAVFSFRDAGLI